MELPRHVWILEMAGVVIIQRVRFFCTGCQGRADRRHSDGGSGGEAELEQQG